MHAMLDELIGISGAVVTANEMTPDSTRLSEISYDVQLMFD